LPAGPHLAGGTGVDVALLQTGLADHVTVLAAGHRGAAGHLKTDGALHSSLGGRNMQIEDTPIIMREGIGVLVYRYRTQLPGLPGDRKISSANRPRPAGG